MRKIISLSLVVASAILFSGCATLFGGGSNQNINIMSKKETVVDIYKVDEKEKIKIHSNVKVPSTINVNRSNDNILIKPIEDSECNEYVVEKKTNGWFFGDVLALSLLSTTVDAVTGAMWEYDEHAELVCK